MLLLAFGAGLAGGEGRSWGSVSNRTEGEATTLLGSREMPGFCSAFLWLSGSFPRYSCTYLSELRFCMRWGVRGLAQEEDCADVVGQVQYGQAITAGAPQAEVTYFVLVSA